MILCELQPHNKCTQHGRRPVYFLVGWERSCLSTFKTLSLLCRRISSPLKLTVVKSSPPKLAVMFANANSSQYLPFGCNCKCNTFVVKASFLVQVQEISNNYFMRRRWPSIHAIKSVHTTIRTSYS